MTKIRGNVLTIPGFTAGLQQDTAIAPLGSFVSASNLVPLLGSRMGIRGGSRVVNVLHDDVPLVQYSDAFTGADATALTAHTPTGGGFTWEEVVLDAYHPSMTILGNAAISTVYNGSGFVAGMNYTNVSSGDADCYVQAAVTIPSATDRQWRVFLGLRSDLADGSGGYICVLVCPVGTATCTVGILHITSGQAYGSMTAMVTVPSVALTRDVAHTFRFEAEGKVLRCLLDGVEAVSYDYGEPFVVDPTPEWNAAGAGSLGMLNDGGSTGQASMDAFEFGPLQTGPQEVTHIPRIHPFSPVGMVAVSYSEGQEKHYATRLTTDGEFFTGTESTSRTDLTASPSTSWDTAEPARPTCAELWEKLFLADGNIDYAERNTFLSLAGDGTVLEPTFAFDGGSAQALKPYCLEEFNNVLFLAGYGDETVGDRPEMVRHSFLGKSPDAADGFDSAAWIMIGAKGQRVTAMCKGDTAMLVAKTNELYRISGYGRAYAGWQYEVEHIQQSLGLGCYGPYALCFAQGYWYGVGQNGPFRTDGVDVQSLRGPREHAWALVSSPEAFSVDYHPDRGLVLFSVRQATGLPEGLYLSNGVVTPPEATYPNVLWAWDVNRDVWSSDLGFNQQFFHVRAIPTITTQSPQGTPTALAASDISTTGYTGNWTNGDPTAETEFYERAGVAGSFSLAGTAGDGDTSLVRTGLQPHTRYFYYLQHLKGGIRSTPSATIEVLTEIAAPGLDVIPGRLEDPTTDTVLLITVTEGGMGLVIEQSADGIGGWMEYVDVPNQGAGVTSLAVATPYYYRVYSYDTTWTPTDSDYSNEVFAPDRT